MEKTLTVKQLLENDNLLLLIDISARLPFGLKGKCEIDASYDTSFDTIIQYHKFDAVLEGINGDLLFVTPLIEDQDENEYANEEVADGIDIECFKPYLRPMSSMTKEEEYEYHQIRKRNSDKLLTLMDCNDHLQQLLFPIITRTESIDWLNAHHFDYRGLIEKGLALEAPKGMYKEK